MSLTIGGITLDYLDYLAVKSEPWIYEITKETGDIDE